MTTPNLNKALAEAKKKIPTVTVSRQTEIQTKTRKITFTYAELEQIQQLVVPIISEFGLSMVHQVISQADQMFLKTTLRHESGEEIESILPITTTLIAFGSGDYKDIATAISYARRYNFLCLLDVCVVESDDWSNTKAWLSNEVRKEIRRENRDEKGMGTPSTQPAPKSVQSSSTNNSTKPTDAQLSRMWAIAHGKNVSKERVRELIKTIGGVESAKDMTVAKYNDIVAAIEAEGGLGIQSNIDTDLARKEIDSQFT